MKLRQNKSESFMETKALNLVAFVAAKKIRNRRILWIFFMRSEKPKLAIRILRILAYRDEVCVLWFQFIFPYVNNPHIRKVNLKFFICFQL